MAGGSGDLRAAPWHDWIDFFQKNWPSEREKFKEKSGFVQIKFVCLVSFFREKFEVSKKKRFQKENDFFLAIFNGFSVGISPSMVLHLQCPMR